MRPFPLPRPFPGRNSFFTCGGGGGALVEEETLIPLPRTGNASGPQSIGDFLNGTGNKKSLNLMTVANWNVWKVTFFLAASPRQVARVAVSDGDRAHQLRVRQLDLATVLREVFLGALQTRAHARHAAIGNVWM